MKMTFRWYGSESDKITLKQIKQIPGCTGLMGVLDYKAGRRGMGRRRNQEIYR